MKKFTSIFFLGYLCLVFLSCDDNLSDGIELSAIKETGKTKCATEEHMKNLLEDPDYAAERAKRLLAFEELNKRGPTKSGCANPVIIPVAIHYQGVNSNDPTCLISMALGQIDILNQDFSGTNTDISTWTSQAAAYFPGISHGETCVRFVLADQNHPGGYGLVNGDPAVTINQTSGDQLGQWSGYLNIFVQVGLDYLGYAPLGGRGDGDGVVIDASAFGAGPGCGGVSPQSPYNKGRTTTHEVGHYLLLDHIWGEGCGIDDEVNDTPDQSSDYYGCPALGAGSCGSTDMHMNYMDYTNDDCMYMFSAGQSNRMENYLLSSLSSLTNMAGTVFSGSEGTGGSGSPGGDPIAICEAPSSMTAESQGSTSVRVDWSDIPDASRYRLRYRIVNSGSWSVRNTGVSEMSIQNLQSEVEYEYQVKTRCPSGWTGWSAKQLFFLQAANPDPSSDFQIVITLDDYGSETTWYIVNENGRDIYSGGPYQDNRSGLRIEQMINLYNACYTLDILDSWGDGMCCEYGQGSIEILDFSGQTVAYSDGHFGTYELIEFCVDHTGLRISKQKRDSKKINRQATRKK